MSLPVGLCPAAFPLPLAASALPSRCAPPGPLLACLLQDGSKLELTHVWQPDEWPDYDSLPPLPPGADRWMWARVKAAAAAVEAAQLGAAPLSPWHYSFNASEWADEPGVLEQAAAHAAAINEERQRLVAAAQAQHVAAAQQRAEAAQRAAQSTSAAAKIDEFDAGFFREVAGGCIFCGWGGRAGRLVRDNRLVPQACVLCAVVANGAGQLRQAGASGARLQ